MDEYNQIQIQKQAIEKYLPKMLSADEVYNIISSIEDKSIPSVMRYFKANYNTTADMKMVGEILRTKF